MPEEKNLEGLQGWLILVGIGVVISPLRIIAQVFPLYFKIFRSGDWSVLTTPGSEAYHPAWAPILLSEIIINFLLLLVGVYLAIQFFTKKRLFPNFFIGLSLFTLAFILLDALAVKLPLPHQPVFDADTLKEFIRSLVGVIIWVPYMLLSKRVKATFVN